MKLFGCPVIVHPEGCKSLEDVREWIDNRIEMGYPPWCVPVSDYLLTEIAEGAYFYGRKRP